MTKRIRQYIGILAVLYYTTIALLLLDPLYLSVLCGLFGGGDMNGIALLLPEWAARLIFGGLLLADALVFWKRILPVYTGAHKTVILKITIMASVRQDWERNNGYLGKAGYPLFFCLCVEAIDLFTFFVYN